ncbi:uncharacterized protein LOC143252264 isoform X1 [Tachypleus tridentatus]|uniref:uncharacterized protein LOC143252264 isoform X1 n=1 Tax=Tachypleus tridentatus TaxID=6853 RepID=UPI003FCEEBB3
MYLREKDEGIDQLCQQIRQLRVELAEMKSKVVQSANMIKELQGTLEDKQSYLLKKDRVMAKKEVELKDLQRSYESYQHKIFQLSAQVIQKDGDLAEMKKENAQLQIQINTLLEEVECMRNSQATVARGENTSLSRHAKMYLREKDEGIDQLCQQIRQLRVEFAEMKSKVVQSANMIKELQGTLEDKQSYLLKKDRVMAKKEVELKDLQRSYESYQHQIFQLSAQVIQKDGDLAEMKKENAQLQIQINTLLEEVECMRNSQNLKEMLISSGGGISSLFSTPPDIENFRSPSTNRSVAPDFNSTLQVTSLNETKPTETDCTRCNSLEIERASWVKEQSNILKSLHQSESEVIRLKKLLQTTENENNGNAVVDKNKKQFHKAYYKYRRAESYRRSLVYQKKYLLKLINGYQTTEIVTMALLSKIIDEPIDNHQTILSPLALFRSATYAIIALRRMLYLVKRWQKAVCI